MNNKKTKIIASALLLGVQRIALIGGFLVPIELAADVTDNAQAFVDVWGSYDWIDTVDASTGTTPDDISGVLGSGSSYAGGGSGGSSVGPNDKDPNRQAKGCAETLIRQVTGGTATTATITDMMTQVTVNRSANGMNATTAQTVLGIDAVTWANLGAAGQRCNELQPAYTAQGWISFPTDANGGPAMLSDPQSYAYLQSHLPGPNGTTISYGSYGPTWLGLANVIGLTQLAQAFASTGNGEALAQEFFLQHEFAHGQTQFPTHQLTRDESTFFTASGVPASVDGVALLNMAAIRANQPSGGTFTQELNKLKQLGFNIPTACYPTDPNC